MIDIKNSDDLFGRLNKLKTDTPPVFGRMSAQHMVEHLAWTLTFANGKSPQEFRSTPEKIAANKQVFLNADRDYPMGTISSVLGDQLPALVYKDLPESIQALSTELSTFHLYFAAHPESRPIHPRMGGLGYEDWVLFHNIHFTHHFKQFGLNN